MGGLGKILKSGFFRLFLKVYVQTKSLDTEKPLVHLIFIRKNGPRNFPNYPKNNPKWPKLKIPHKSLNFHPTMYFQCLQLMLCRAEDLYKNNLWKKNSLRT